MQHAEEAAARSVRENTKSRLWNTRIVPFRVFISRPCTQVRFVQFQKTEIELKFTECDRPFSVFVRAAYVSNASKGKKDIFCVLWRDFSLCLNLIHQR
jgi:hypothetical protein